MKGTSGVTILPVLDLLTLLIVVFLSLGGLMGIVRPEGVIGQGELNHKKEILVKEHEGKKDLDAKQFELTDQSNQLKKKNEELKQEIAAGPTQVTALNEITRTREALQSAVTTLQKTRTRLEELARQIAALSAELGYREQDTAQIESALASEVVEHERKIKDLAAEKTSALTRMAELQAALQGLREERKTLEQVRNGLMQELELVRIKIVNGPDQASANKKLEATQLDMKGTSERLEQTENALAAFEDQMTKLKQDLAARAKAISNLPGQLASETQKHQSRLHELERQKEGAITTQATLKARLQALELERQKVSGERDRLQKALAQQEKDLNNGTDQKTLESQITEIKRAIQEAAAGLDRVEEAQRVLREEIERKKHQVASAEKETSNLQKVVSSEKTEQEALWVSLEAQKLKALKEQGGLQTTLSRLEMEREELEETRARLQRRLDELQVTDPTSARVEKMQRRLSEDTTLLESDKERLEALKAKLTSLTEEIEEQEETIKSQAQHEAELSSEKSEIEEHRSTIKELEEQTVAKERRLKELQTVLANAGKETYSVTSGAPKVRRNHQADKMIIVVLSKGKAIPLKVPFYGGKKYSDGTIVVKPKRAGLDIDAALRANSPIMDDVLTPEFREKGQVSILVNPDSFPEFRKLRDFLAKESISVGWDPLEGTTIAFVEDGNEGRTIPPQ